jgi:hypothetical protein
MNPDERGLKKFSVKALKSVSIRVHQRSDFFFI